MRREVCKLCGVHLDTGLSRGVTLDHVDRSLSWDFDQREALSTLSICCINCFFGIISLSHTVPRAPAIYRHQFTKRKPPSEEDLKAIQRYDADPVERLRLCAARYASNLIKEKLRGGRKRARIIEVPQPISDDRQILMLRLMLRAAGFRDKKNREISESARAHGTAAFWLDVSIFRRLRKHYRIRGDVCRPFRCVKTSIPNDQMRDYFWFEQPEKDTDAYKKLFERRGDNPFEGWKMFQHELLKLEKYMRQYDGALPFSWSWNRRLVWEEIFEEKNFFNFTPLLSRLKVYKREMAQRNWERLQMKKMDRAFQEIMA
jgi:hypothetical protein